MAGNDEPIKDDPKEPCAKTYTWIVDGKEVTVTLTLVDGKIIAKIESDVDMDVNALYWGDDDGKGDFEGFTKKDSSLNMNGGGSQYEGEAVLWDDAQKISSPGSKDVGFISAGESQEFELKMTPEEFEALVYFGIRATSVGEDGEDSLKLVGKPEDCPPDDKEDDFFPEWKQDVSNIILVFDQTEGDDKPKPDGDGYYTVKIDEWDGSRDIDDEIDDILAWLIDNDPNITEDSVLLGVIIKGGVQDTNFYAYGDNDTNGTLPDGAPDGLALSWEGSSNPAPANAVDESYDYEDVFAVA